MHAGGWGNEDESQAGWDHAQSGQGCGNEQADTSQEGQQAQGWGDEHAAPGWGNGHANHNDAAEKPSEQASLHVVCSPAVTLYSMFVSLISIWRAR